MKKRPKKLPVTTPRAQIRRALRLLWLHSRERAAALKRDNYTCQACHKKHSTAKGKEFKVEVHHCSGDSGIDAVIDYIYRQLLCDHSKLVTLCPKCHDEEEQNAQ
jgi:hypothetical protein